jgi:hypothetical protein
MNKRSRYGSLAPLILAAVQIVVGQTYSQSTAIDMEGLTNRADVIAVGKIASLRSEWNQDRSRIVTRATIAVDQYLKGEQPQRSLVITVPGGEIDGVGEMYSHTARFKPDEQVVVFATADNRGQLGVVGGDVGKMTVARDKVTGLQMVADKEPLSAFTSRLKGVVQAQSRKE